MEVFATGFSIFGDSAYGLSQLLINIIKAARSLAEKRFNKVMSILRVCAEWGFGGVGNKLQWIKDPDNIVLGKGGSAITISVLVILTNLVWCCERPQTSTYFRVLPPAPTEYLHEHLTNEPANYVNAEGDCICPVRVRQMWDEASRAVKKALLRGRIADTSAVLGN